MAAEDMSEHFPRRALPGYMKFSLWDKDMHVTLSENYSASHQGAYKPDRQDRPTDKKTPATVRKKPRSQIFSQWVVFGSKL